MEFNYPKIALQSVDGLVFVRKQEVLYALADGNYSHMHLTNNRKIKVLRKLKEVDQLLADDIFIRIHNSHLINLGHIVRFNQTPSDKVLMSDGNALEVSRSRKTHFIKKFTRI